MGAKQTKGQEAGGASPQHGWRRTPTKERGDILASLMLKSGDRVGRGGSSTTTPPPPYQRRIGMIQEMMLMAKQGKQDEATEMLKTLRQGRTLRARTRTEAGQSIRPVVRPRTPPPHPSLGTGAGKRRL